MTQMVDVREYLDRDGNNPFRDWRSRLNVEARRKVTIALFRVGLGNLSNAKGVGGSLFEYKIGFGPGYRIYFGKDGDQVVILLGGGTKQRQQRGIDIATERWQDYKRRKTSKNDKEQSWR
jgi:putative addiction module killer protein